MRGTGEDEVKMLRRIGINGVKCFDGDCNPWSKSVICASCAVRPMKVYSGNEGKLESIKRMNDEGWGVLLTSYRDTSIFRYYCVDNGAFSAWKNEREWDAEHFVKTAEKFANSRKKPDFIVVPDKVACGLDSLDHSLDWLDKMPEGDYRRYLAVQDGMDEFHVENVIDDFGGLFVGGTIDWKYSTAKHWIKLAHNHNLPCHIGRVGTVDRIIWAARIGADSIDSSSWAMNGTYDYLKAAQKQTILDEVI